MFQSYNGAVLPYIQQSPYHFSLIIKRLSLTGNAVRKIFLNPLGIQLPLQGLFLLIRSRFVKQHRLKASFFICGSFRPPIFQSLPAHMICQNRKKGNIVLPVSPLRKTPYQSAAFLHPVKRSGKESDPVILISFLQQGALLLLGQHYKNCRKSCNISVPVMFLCQNQGILAVHILYADHQRTNQRKLQAGALAFQPGKQKRKGIHSFFLLPKTCSLVCIKDRHAALIPQIQFHSCKSIPCVFVYIPSDLKQKRRLIIPLLRITKSRVLLPFLLCQSSLTDTGTGISPHFHCSCRKQQRKKQGTAFCSF